MSLSPPPTDPDAPAKTGPGNWIRRLGVAGFLFFLVKGLLWLIVPAVAVAVGSGC